MQSRLTSCDHPRSQRVYNYRLLTTVLYINFCHTSSPLATMSRVSKRLKRDPSPSAELDEDDAVSMTSDVNELNEDEYEKERLENIK